MCGEKRFGHLRDRGAKCHFLLAQVLDQWRLQHFGGRVDGTAGGEEGSGIAKRRLRRRAVGLGDGKLAVEIGQLLLRQGGAIGEEETGLCAERLGGGFRFLHFGPQVRDLFGEPACGFAVDAGFLLDLLLDIEFGQPVRHDGGHTGIGRGEHDRDHTRTGLLVHLKFRKYDVGDFLDVG